MTTKFAFIRDPRCPDRVLTVARKLVGDDIHYGYCVNKVIEVDLSKVGVAYSRHVAQAAGCWESGLAAFVRVQGVATVVLDNFDRKLGKRIAEGRMQKRPFVVARDEFSPHVTVLRDINATGDATVSRLTGEYLDYLFDDEG